MDIWISWIFRRPGYSDSVTIKMRSYLDTDKETDEADVDEVLVGEVEHEDGAEEALLQ